MAALACCCTLLFAAPARAVVVFLKGEATPRAGFLVRQDERHVVIDQVLPGGGRRQITLTRDQIDVVIQNVSAERLAALAPDQPGQYREYADELAVKKDDPEARETALRLYLAAAWLDTAKLGRSSLLGMIDLARSPAEERKFRAQAYLLDPKADRAVLRPVAVAKVSAGAPDAIPRKQLLNALQTLRRGNTSAALRLGEAANLAALWEENAKTFSLDEFRAACRAGELSPEALYKLLQLELALTAALGGESAEPAEADDHSTSWREGLRRHGRAPPPALSLETLTEFDPRECVHRDGKWTRPKE